MNTKLMAQRTKNANFTIVPLYKNDVKDFDTKSLCGTVIKKQFEGEDKDILTVLSTDGKQKYVFLGLGKESSPKVHLYIRSCINSLKIKDGDQIDILVNHCDEETIEQIALGAELSAYKIGHFKTTGNNVKAKVSIILNKKHTASATKGLHIGAAQTSIMELVDYPSNIKTPDYICQHATRSAKKWGYSIKVYDVPALKKMGMHALLSVGQGSVHPPRFAVLEYKPKGSINKSPVLGLVGKGISFDTGGVSIKPSANMGYMKCDMAGAAAVIGAMEISARLKVNTHLVGVIACAENAVDGKSIRPGDVISSYSGKSIEVIDTDAEGRLVLADGISYILKNHKPEYLVDMATLTGSCVATLGNVAAGLMTSNDSFAEKIAAAGDKSYERVWRLPLWNDYASEMNSDIADIKNLSTRPVAGAITAGKFLEFFTEEHPNWAHLDIAGVAFTDSEFAKSRTATAFGVRLMLSLIEGLKAKKTK
jgi:leucyl aminopeptidase